MARIRTIKPEFPQSESMGNVSRDARLCFVQMWTLADDSGRLRGSSRMLASLLFPYDDDAPELMPTWLAELQREGCLELYQIDGATYIQITNWLSHQKIDRPSPSKIPEFSESSRILANPREASSLDQGSRIKDQGPGEDHVAAQSPSAPEPRPATKRAPAPSQTGPTWEAYSTAYFNRYGTEPVRNAKVNGQLAQLVARLGALEAPSVAAFFVGHQNAFYVRSMHAVDSLLKDAEKLRTEWATNRKVTNTQANQADKTAANFGAFQRLIEEAEAEERANGKR